VALLGEIGIREKMPSRWLRQLWVPFVWKRYQQEG
jgi:hypothetical protein